MTQNKIQTPKAIIFDLGGVLMDWDRRYLYKKLFRGRPDELDYFLNTVCTFPWNDDLDAGLSFNQGTAERAALFPEYAEYIHAYQDRWVEMIGGSLPETVHIMAQLREQGYPLYALSNWSAETFPIVLKQYDFLSWFDEVVLSGEVKITKPAPGIYQALLAKIPFKPEECVFIDDSMPNIKGGEALGIPGIHFVGAEDLAARLREMGIKITFG